SAATLLKRGREHAGRREWDRALECYAQSLRLAPTDNGHFWFEYAALLLLCGERGEHEKACARMVERCGKAPRSVLRPYHVARARAPAGEVAGYRRLAEKELKEDAREPWSLTQQAALTTAPAVTPRPCLCWGRAGTPTPGPASTW